MIYKLRFSDKVKSQVSGLKIDKGLAKRLKAVQNALNKLKNNPRHPGLQTHEFHSLYGPNGEKVFEAYAEQNTPAAYRIFFHYGPEKRMISIISITPHP
ncbi:MAG: hypothetical protein ABIC68_04650 [Candidatus Omnitrophota bacterium]